MAACEAGPRLILAFVANGVIAEIVGSCYAELSAMLPHAGNIQKNSERLSGLKTKITIKPTFSESYDSQEFQFIGKVFQV